MRSKVRRCSREYSRAWSWSLAEGLSKKFGSYSLDIAFSPPGKNEGAAPALFRFAIDPRPKGNKVIERRNQRKQNHEPDRDPRNPVNRENIDAEQRPLMPAAGQNHSHHRNNLNQHLEFA